MVQGTVLNSLVDILLLLLLGLVAASRVGVVVYPRVTGQLVAAGEALCAGGKLAGVGLLARVRANVSGLMLESVKGLFAERALVGTGEILTLFLVGASDHGGHHADGRHLCFTLLTLNLSQLDPGRLLLSLQLGARELCGPVGRSRGRLWVE